MMIVRKQPSAIMHRIVEANGIIYIGGTTADDVTSDMKGQTEQILRKFDHLLASVGSDKTKILSVMVFITEFEQKPMMDEAWKAWLDPATLPARATVGVSELGKGTLVEMIMTAAK